jgi:rifampicin phosphotransferase
LTQKFWIDFEDKHPISESGVGGKAFNLFKLNSFGIKVPRFGVVTTKAHEFWLSEGKLPLDLISQITSKFTAGYFAVRSSMVGEDGVEHSFAGIMETYLYITSDDFEEYIIRCFKSLDGDRAEEYTKRIDPSKEKAAAVIIQEMIPSDLSGVAFSRNPVKDSSLVLIEAGIGLGEGIVSGVVEVDKYYVNRFKEIVKQEVQKKESSIQYDPIKKCVTTISIEEEKSCLSDKQILKLFDEILRIEEYYQCPVDIEWAYCTEKGEDPIILQVRPITQKFSALEYYVDTNLAESYPGLTSPLTGSLIPYFYYTTYAYCAEFLGLKADNLKKVSPHLLGLVRYIEGHLYYNLKNYHTILSMLPGGNSNIDKWHKMIGGKLEGIKIDYTKSRVGPFLYWRTFSQLMHFSFFQGQYISKFEAEGNEKFAHFNQKIEDSKGIESLMKVLSEIVEYPWKMYVYILNDVMIMVFLGILEKSLKKKNISDGDIAGILKTNDQLDSVGPLIELKSLLEKLQDRDRFFEVFEKAVTDNPIISYEELYQILKNDSNQKENVTLIMDYLARYGSRCFEELKYESLAFSDSPKVFFEFLNWSKNIEYNLDDELDKSSNAPIFDQLNFFEKWIWRRLHKYIAAREKLRLIRGRLNSLIRTTFLKIIEELRKNKEVSDLDYKNFYALTYQDLKKGNEKEMIATILKDGLWWQKELEFPEFVVWDGVTPSYISEGIIDQGKMDFDGDYLKGTGTNELTTTGEILVLATPQEAMKYQDLSNKILVTKSTDPGWVFIISKCKGLISEKGSLLSHTAIIGRELNIPTIVGVKQATKILSNDQMVELNCRDGLVIFK